MKPPRLSKVSNDPLQTTITTLSADLTTKAHGTFCHPRPMLLRRITLLTLPGNLGLTSLVTVVATFGALNTCKLSLGKIEIYLDQ